MADIQLPDGNIIQVPDYTLEETQEKILAELKKVRELSKADQKVIRDIVKNTAAQLKNDQKTAEEQRRITNEQLERLRRIERNSRDTTVFSVPLFKAALLDLGKTAGTAAGLMLSASSSIAGILKAATTRIGDVVGRLTDVGVGFDDVTGSSTDVLSGMQRLGLTVTDSADYLRDFSGVVQTLGKRDFIAFQNEFAKVTRYGAQFGMTMDEAASIMLDYLDSRKALGILDRMEAVDAAKRSETLYQMQLDATRVLGKSIDSIKSAGKSALANNEQVQLQMAALERRFGVGSKAANDLADAVELAGSQFDSLGVDQSMAEDLIYRALHPLTFAGEDGAAVLTGIQVAFGENGVKLADELMAIGQLMQGSEADIAKGTAMFKQLPEKFANLVEGIDGKAIKLLQHAGDQFNNEFLRVLSRTVNSVSLASRRLDEAAKEQAKFPALTEGVKSFEQAVKSIHGNLSAILTDASGTLGPVINEFAKAITEDSEGTTSILTAMRYAINDVTKSILDLIRPTDQTKKGVRSLAEELRQYLVPKIQEFSAYIIKSINSFKGEKTFGQLLSEQASKLRTTLENVYEFGVVLKKIAVWLKDTFKWLFTTESGGTTASENEMYANQQQEISNLAAKISAVQLQLEKATDDTTKSELSSVLAELKKQQAEQIGLLKEMKEPADPETNLSWKKVVVVLGGFVVLKSLVAGMLMRMGSGIMTGLGKLMFGRNTAGPAAATSAGRAASRFSPGKLGAGAVVGMGSDIAADYVGRDTKTGAAIDIAGQTASFALMGAAIGGPAAPITAALGGAVGLGLGVWQNWDTLFGKTSAGEIEHDTEMLANASENLSMSVLANMDAVKITETSAALTGLVATYERFADIDTKALLESATAINQLTASLQTPNNNVSLPAIMQAINNNQQPQTVVPPAQQLPLANNPQQQSRRELNNIADLLSDIKGLLHTSNQHLRRLDNTLDAGL